MSSLPKSSPGRWFPNTVLNSLLYLSLFALAVIVFQFIDPTWLAKIGVTRIATLVSTGAAGAALVSYLVATGKLPALPSRNETSGLLITTIAVGLSSLAFWAVSVHASMIVAAVAQPLRVLVETALAGPLLSNRNAVTRRDRMFFDAALGTLLLGLVLATGQFGAVTVPMVLGMVVALIGIGTLSELLLLRLQVRASEHDAHPARRVALINVILAFGFFAASIITNAEPLSADEWLNALLLVLVGAIGTAGPTIAKLKLVGQGHAPSDVSILALGFTGAVGVVALAGLAVVWAIGFAIPLPTILLVLQSQVTAPLQIAVSALIMLFVLTRFWSDARTGGPDQDGTGRPKPVENDPKSRPLVDSIDTDWADRVQPSALAAYDMAYAKVSDAQHDRGIASALRLLLDARRDLGHAGFQTLPVSLLKAVNGRITRFPNEAAPIRDALLSYQAAREQAQRSNLTSAQGRVSVTHMERVYKSLKVLIHTGEKSLHVRLAARRLRSHLLWLVSGALLVLAHGSAPIAELARKLPGRTGLEIWSGALATALERFATPDALFKSGLEVSLGIRFVIPGTGGLLANIGIWIMAYTGSLAGYLTRSNPMLLNPGVTFATPFWIGTYNRPGIGMGPSLPFGNAYVDAQRYKLLLGADGVGYVRVGHWEGRGPYGTVSGSFPIVPGLRGTWNTSLFSPGLEPVVARSTPLARWVRARSDTMATRFVKLWR